MVPEPTSRLQELPAECLLPMESTTKNGPVETEGNSEKAPFSDGSRTRVGTPDQEGPVAAL
jgi:hypothetical protein